MTDTTTQTALTQTAPSTQTAPAQTTVVPATPDTTTQTTTAVPADEHWTYGGYDVGSIALVLLFVFLIVGGLTMAWRD